MIKNPLFFQEIPEIQDKICQKIENWKFPIFFRKLNPKFRKLVENNSEIDS